MRNTLYKYAIATLIGIMPAIHAQAQEDACGMGVGNVAIKRSADLITVDMNLDLNSFDMHGNRVSVFSPIMVNGTDTLVFQPVGLYSRTRWYQYLRAGEKPLGGENETSIRWSERPKNIEYSQTVPYSEWMNGSQLYLKRADYGCCRTLIDECIAPLLRYKEYAPVFHYIRPVAEEVKLRELVGKAYIDFPVNRTELYPDYRKNPIELAKIIATIDSVRSDKDVTVKRITIKGWASPESSWENNTRLAKGRTATLKEYVQKLYNFPDNFIETDYYPEDWFGLRAFVEGSGLQHKTEILALIDDATIDPDPKEYLIKTRYPEEYKFLLNTVYPGLRHSDYTIEYTIRQFTDIDEIRIILTTAPQKLSLNEMYMLAQSYEPGTKEYNEVFEVAVRMYPNDEVANLNAANSAMSRKDYESAANYLKKAGNSDEVIYARGILSALQGNNSDAIEKFKQVSASMPEAIDAIETLNGVSENVEIDEIIEELDEKAEQMEEKEETSDNGETETIPESADQEATTEN